MTREEILNMPAGREMDELVQEIVFGTPDHLPVVWEEWSTPDGLDGGNGFVCPRCKTPEDLYTSTKCSKHYSMFMEYAWKVHQKMVHELFSVRKTYFYNLQLVVSGEYTESGEVVIAYPDVFIFVQPKHFCLAALLTMNKK